MATAEVVSIPEQLIPFLSTKLNNLISLWMQSNYSELCTNYKTIYNAYNELKANYDKIKMENELKDKQIEKLKMKIKSTTSQYKDEILDCKQLIESQLNDFIKFKETISKQSIIAQNYNQYDKNSNNLLQSKPVINNEEIDKLKNKITMLENDIYNATNKGKLYQNEIKNLKQENKDLIFKLNFDKKCIENKTSLNEMNYQQTQERYSRNTTNHEKNMKAMHLFLSQINCRCQSFLNKYNLSNKKNEEEEDIDIENEISIRDIEPKLKATYANLEQFLVDVSMIILSKETHHLNVGNAVDMDLIVSDVDI